MTERGAGVCLPLAENEALENVTGKSWYTYRYTFFKTKNFISVISRNYKVSA